jgi:folate-binding protein YgfZ
MAPDAPATLVADAAEVVWLSGEDRLAYLERMSTNRLTDLAPGSGRATAILNDAGRVVDLVAAYAGPDGLALVTSATGAAAPLSAHLKRYALYRDRVRITDASPQVTVLRVVGPDSLSSVTHATGLDVAGLPPGGWLRDGVGADEVWALRHPDPGGLGGVDVVVPRGATVAMATRLSTAGAVGGAAGDVAAWRVDARLPAFGAEIDGQANPLELGLRGIVDFEKGCYIGQEVVARLDAYEKVQRQLVRVVGAAQWTVGDALRLADAVDGAARGRRSAGRITTVAPADGSGRWWALALVPAAWPDGATLEVVSRLSQNAGPQSGPASCQIKI